MIRHTQNSTRPLQPEVTLSDAQFAVVRDLLARYSGVYLDSTRQRVLTNSITRRVTATGQSLEAYIASLSRPSGQSELQQLIELSLNHETVFFRNMPHIQALRQVILPDLHRHKPPGAPLRLWSAGCSTGEEAYSLAIVLLETLREPLPRPVHVYATDLSESALERARSGWYRGRTLGNVTPDLQARYFRRQEDGWAVHERVRNLVHFEQRNLLESFPDWVEGIDVIFCQNVTIYFQLATCRALIERFYQALPDGGFLFLGFSETLWNIHNGFRLQETSRAFVYCKADALRSAHHTTPSERSDNRAEHSPPLSTRHLLPHSRKLRCSGNAPLIDRPDNMRLQQAHNLSRPAVPALADSNEIVQQGYALLEAGEVEKVLDMLTHIPLNGPHAPQAVTLIARAHANRGDLDLAFAEVRRAMELDPLSIDAHILLGMLYAQQGQYPSAAQYLERARYLDPDAALISFHLAEVYRQLNYGNKALREYKNTLRKLTDHPPDRLLDGVAVHWIRETCQRYIETLTDKYWL